MEIFRGEKEANCWNLQTSHVINIFSVINAYLNVTLSGTLGKNNWWKLNQILEIYIIGLLLKGMY